VLAVITDKDAVDIFGSLAGGQCFCVLFGTGDHAVLVLQTRCCIDSKLWLAQKEDEIFSNLGASRHGSYTSDLDVRNRRDGFRIETCSEQCGRTDWCADWRSVASVDTRSRTVITTRCFLCCLLHWHRRSGSAAAACWSHHLGSLARWCRQGRAQVRAAWAQIACGWIGPVAVRSEPRVEVISLA